MASELAFVRGADHEELLEIARDVCAAAAAFAVAGRFDVTDNLVEHAAGLLVLRWGLGVARSIARA